MLDPQGRRCAKDPAYAGAVRAAWAAEAASWSATDIQAEDLVYEHDGLQLHGRVVRPSAANGAGVVLIHTAVGPHDLFLHWKAEALAALGYTVLIADMLGDPDGRAWARDWSEAARRPLREDRALGRRRARAAVARLAGLAQVDPSRLGALGYCFGGQAVLDLARLGAGAGVAAVASFHGILDDGAIPAADMAAAGAPRVLICHGEADPFVTGRDACERQLQASGARWEMLAFPDVRHGFTNPAQALNDNPAFGFDEVAAVKSWGAAVELLEQALAP